MRHNCILTKLFVLAACLSCVLGASAATYYGFKVGGVSVNSDNCNNVTGNNILSGTVKYDHSTKTVTLTNVSISRTGSDNRAILNESNTGLIIKFVGTNELSAQDASAVRFNTSGSIVVSEGSSASITGGTENAIYSYNSAIAISGPGDLHVSASGSAAIEGKGASSSSTLSFSNITADIYGSKGDLFDFSNVTFNTKSYVTLTATNNSSYPSARNIGSMTFNSGAIRQPSGATYSSSSQAIVLNGTKVYNKDILITQHPDFKVGDFYYLVTGTNEVSVTYKDTNYGSYSTRYLTIPETVTYDGKTYQVTGIYAHAFDGCENVVSVTLNNNIRTIGYYAFRNCTRLSKATLNNVTSIGNYAYQNCSSLGTITFGTSMSVIGQYAFDGCNQIVYIYANNPNPPTIDTNTFSEYGAVVKVATPWIASLYRSRTGWSNFTNITPNQTYDFAVDNIYYIKTSSSTVSVTNGSISYGDYHDFVFIPEWIIYDDMTYFVTGINDYAFRNCAFLYGVYIHERIKTIGAGAFLGCTQLTSVTLPHSITSIGTQAFNQCTNLATIVSMATTPPTIDNAFSGLYTSATLYVLNGKTTDYGNSNYWRNFYNIKPVCTISEVQCSIGDVNGDGDVSISDVTALIDLLLSGGTASAEADVNGDGEVGISDVTTLIDMLLSGTTSAGSSRKLHYTVAGIPFTMVVVDGGTFTMGATSELADDANNNEYPTHQVSLLTYGIGETEVTQALWRIVMGVNPSDRVFNTNTYPVECVSWDDCQAFTYRLNLMTNMSFRLPTEAEWEFAARGGNKSKGYKYAGSNSIDEVAWYQENTNTVTMPIAYKAPNELGLYDMSGNVEEWVYDRYGSYSGNAQNNPTGPTTGTDRVVRGGSYASPAKSCRVSKRGYAPQTDKYINTGLRIAHDYSN